jgi:hypothetical protein
MSEDGQWGISLRAERVAGWCFESSMLNGGGDGKVRRVVRGNIVFLVGEFSRRDSGGLVMQVPEIDDIE